MKKRGVTFIETVIAIVIFLIAILPVAYLSFNSLRSLKRASEIEEGARVTTTVINYIKSQGYDNLRDNSVLSSSDPSDTTYVLKLADDGSSYILDLDEGDDFEEDFLGGSSGRSAASVTVTDSLFLINSLGISSDTIKIVVNIATSDLKIVEDDDGDGSYSADTTYINPITSSTSGNGVIIGSGGIIDTPVIFGNVAVTYETLSDASKEEKSYDQNFVVTPLENFKN